MYFYPSQQKRFHTATEARLYFPDVSFPRSVTDSVLMTVGVFPLISAPPAYNPQLERLVDAGNFYSEESQRWEVDWRVEPLPEDVVVSANTARIEAIRHSIVESTQARLDDFAKTRGYDDIKSASDYAGCSVPKFDVEGRYCRDARAETWAKLHEILGQVESGARPIPSSFAEIEPELPSLSWPTS